MITFAERFKQLRNEKGISQRELAKLLSFGASTVAMYETGQRLPDGETLVKIADYFNVSADYLLGRTDQKNPKSKTIYTGKEISDKILQEEPELYSEFSEIEIVEFMKEMKEEEISLKDIKEVLETLRKFNKSNIVE